MDFSRLLRRTSVRDDEQVSYATPGSTRIVKKGKFVDGLAKIVVIRGNGEVKLQIRTGRLVAKAQSGSKPELSSRS